MVSFSIRSNENLEAYRDIADDVIESDFVPYACHYNPHTIVTKNGELLQIIKITGFAHEMLGHREESLRSIIRGAIKECVTSDKFALWFHTIRRQADLSAPGEQSNPFARELQEAWEERNDFHHQYTNEVYISIVHEGQDATMRNMQNFLKGLIPARDIRWRNEYLDSIYEQLNDVTEGILERLDVFGARRLGMYEHRGIFYSEPCQFIEKLINLTERQMPVLEEDLCTYLTSGEITFGFNAMEVRASGRRRFASIVTIKEHKETSLPAIDLFLQQPMEFIVTQYVNFINADIALDQYEDQKLLTDLSGDNKLFQMSEVDAVIKSKGNNPTDFGEHQLTVFILADSIKLLESNVRRAVEFLFNFGMVAIREDLRFEQCYWAQLPGNFEFIKRTIPSSTTRICGFVNLHNFPVGRATGNRWGNAVTTFHTASGAPYYFNFHNEDIGHTSIIGPVGSGKTVLANFLLAQSLKFNPRIVYFDATGSTPIFMEHLGGRHCKLRADISDGESSAPLNPFSLPDTPENREFLARWLVVLLRMAGNPINDAQKADVRAAAEATIVQPKDQRNFTRFIAFLKESSPEAASAFFAWAEGGKYGHVFSHAEDVFDSNPDILAFNLTEVMEESAVLIPVFSYMLQRAMAEMDGVRPGILMLDEAWTLLKNAHVSGNLGAWLNRLTALNAIAIIATENIEDAGVLPFTPGLIEQMATQIYLPNPDPTDEYQESFGLNDLEYAYLDVMETEDRHFLIKREGETVVGELNLSGMDSIIAALVGQRLHDTDNEDLESIPSFFGGVDA